MLTSIASWLPRATIIGSAMTLAAACAGRGADEKKAGDPLPLDERFGTLEQAVGTCSGATLSISPSSPQPAGAGVVLTATVSGCSQPSYIWQVLPPGGAWTKLGKTKPASFGPVTYPAGRYKFRVRVKDKTDGGPLSTSAPQVFEWTTGCTDGWDCVDGSGGGGCEESCVTDPASGLGSFCGSLAEGGAMCVGDSLCADSQDCASSAECADGYVCVVGGCCEGFTGACLIAECPGVPATASAMPEGDGPTSRWK